MVGAESGRPSSNRRLSLLTMFKIVGLPWYLVKMSATFSVPAFFEKLNVAIAQSFLYPEISVRNMAYCAKSTSARYANRCRRVRVHPQLHGDPQIGGHALKFQAVAHPGDNPAQLGFTAAERDRRLCSCPMEDHVRAKVDESS